MIREEIRQLKTSPRDLRKFGLVVGGVFALLAAWTWWRGKPAFPYFLGAALPLLVLGLIWPKALKWVYIGWMSLAFVLGFAVSTVLLTVFFYLVVTPIGLIAKMAGQDFLSRRIDPEAKSYWLPRANSKPRRREEYEQQF